MVHKMVVLVRCLRNMNNDCKIINGWIRGEKKYVWTFERRN